MSRFTRLSGAALAATIFLGASANADPESYLYKYLDQDGNTIAVETQNTESDYLVYLDHTAALISVEAVKSSSNGVKVQVNDGAPFLMSAGPDASAIKSGPAADVCTSPVDITALPYDETFSATALTNTGDFRGTAGAHYSANGGSDAFWALTPSTTGTYSIIVSADDSSMGIGVWEGTCAGAEDPVTDPPSNLTEVGTMLDFTGGGTSAMSVDLNAGTSYFIVAEDHFTSTAPTQIRLQVRLAPAAAGDTVAGAIDLTSEDWSAGFTVNADTTNNANNMDHAVNGAACLSGNNADPVAENDIWFQLPATATGASYTLDTFAVGMSNSYMVLYSANGTASDINDLTEVACNDDKSSGTKAPAPGSDFMSEILFTGDASKTFYLFVESYAVIGTSGSSGPFDLVGSTSSTVTDWTMFN